MRLSCRMRAAKNIDRCIHNVSLSCVLSNSIDLTFSPRARSDCLFTIRGRLSRLLNSPPPSAYKQWNHQLGNKSGDSSSIPLWEVSNNQPCWSQAGCSQIQARGIDRRWLPSISLYLLAGKSAALCVGPLNYQWGRHHFGERGEAVRGVHRSEGGGMVFKKWTLCQTLAQNEVWGLRQKHWRINLVFLFVARNIGNLLMKKNGNMACAINSCTAEKRHSCHWFQLVMEENRETLSMLCVNLNMVTFYAVRCLSYFSSWWYWHATMIDYNAGWPIHINQKQWITALFTASGPECFL